MNYYFHISKSPCLNSQLSLTSLICVGFGDAFVLKDNIVIYREPVNEEDCKSVNDIEQLAKQNPNHDWKIVFNAPLWNATYQRNKNGEWICIESGKGFA